jgi:hypothetical protein
MGMSGYTAASWTEEHEERRTKVLRLRKNK